MRQDRQFAQTMLDHLTRICPDQPVLYFDPQVLSDTLQRFKRGFDGMTTYAVKANPDPTILQNLAALGIDGFDVASPFEVDLIREIAPQGVMHYNNPVRSVSEIQHAVTAGIRSFAVDRVSELRKLAQHTPISETEVSIRLKLPVGGAAYDFGDKYGASPKFASALLREASKTGFKVSMTFHPGTQCQSPGTWESYIKTCGTLADACGVELHRLNVGGGFPSRRRRCEGDDLGPVFKHIHQCVAQSFVSPPELVCEPGRSLVAEACTLAVRAKSIDEDDVTLNDGVYGGMSEFRDIYPIDRISVLSSDGTRRVGPVGQRPVFGPTCDSLDTIPGGLALPNDMREEDYLLIEGMGAYVIGISSRFNGYGDIALVKVKCVTVQ
ncbi:MAG: type III PLP-dependent enzyme [Pseudomonadota bacterium]